MMGREARDAVIRQKYLQGGSVRLLLGGTVFDQTAGQTMVNPHTRPPIEDGHHVHDCLLEVAEPVSHLVLWGGLLPADLICPPGSLDLGSDCLQQLYLLIWTHALVVQLIKVPPDLTGWQASAPNCQPKFQDQAAVL